MPYLSLRLEAQYAGSRTLEVDIPGPNPSITLPQNLWAEVRFFLDTEGEGNLAYYPQVSSSLQF